MQPGVLSLLSTANVPQSQDLTSRADVVYVRRLYSVYVACILLFMSTGFALKWLESKSTAPSSWLGDWHNWEIQGAICFNVHKNIAHFGFRLGTERENLATAQG
jgi:hypothetical protein